MTNIDRAPRLTTNFRLPSLFMLLTVAVFGCSKGPDSQASRLARAGDHFAAGQYEKAEKEYREILRLEPGEQAALRQLAIIYFEQGQLLQAYPLLKQVAEKQADDLDVQLKFATASLPFGQFNESREAALRILDRYPGHQDALLLLADTARSSSDIDEIRAQIETRRAQDQDRPSYHVAFGVLDLKQNKKESAEAELKTAISLDPKSAAGHMSLGLLYWSRNDQKAAAQELKTAAELSSPRASAPLRYLDFLQKTASAQEAKAFLEELNRKVPDALPVRVHLMRLACAKPEDSDCAARVQSILAQDPNNYEALLQDGMLNLAKGDTAKAIREFEQLAGIYLQNAPVRYRLALAYLQLAKGAEAENGRKALESAESNLTTAVKLDPRLEQAALLLADIKIRKGSPAAAVDLLLPLTKDRPQFAQAHYLLASAYLAQHNATQALAVYRRMTDLFPQDAQPWFFIGTQLIAQQQIVQARRAFEKSVSLSPHSLSPIERLIDLDLGEHKFVEARERIQKQIDRDPKIALAWAIRGKIELAERNFAAAEPDLLKATELEPKLERGYLLLAQLYLATNKPEQAIAKLKSFTDGNKSASALMMLGGIQERMKDFPGAKDTYEKVLAIAPNYLPALNNLAVIYSEHLGQLDKAYELAKKARDTNPNEPHAADTLGWIVFKRGAFPEALRLLQDSATKLAASPEIQYHLGSAHYMLGQEDLALAAFKKATAADADFPGKDEARQHIDILSIDPAAATSANRTALQGYLVQRPNDPMALFKLAEIQKRDGALDEAVKTYEKLLAADTFFLPATQRLAVLYSQRSHADAKAFEVTQKAFQAYPDDPQVAKALGILNYRREYYPRASELLQQAAAKHSDDAETLYYLGESQRQLKQWPACKASLERASSLNLPAALADKAKSALAECSESASP